MTEVPNPDSGDGKELAELYSLDDARRKREERRAVEQPTIDYAEYFGREDVKNLLLETEEIIDQQPDLTIWIDTATDEAVDDENSILRVLIAPTKDAPWLTREFRKTYALHNPTTRKALDVYNELDKGHITDRPVIYRYLRLYRCMSALIYARIVRNDYDAGDIEWQERAHKIFPPRLGDFPSLH